jgi:hypothetical protein
MTPIDGKTDDLRGCEKMRGSCGFRFHLRENRPRQRRNGRTGGKGPGDASQHP